MKSKTPKPKKKQVKLSFTEYICPVCKRSSNRYRDALECSKKPITPPIDRNEKTIKVGDYVTRSDEIQDIWLVKNIMVRGHEHVLECVNFENQPRTFESEAVYLCDLDTLSMLKEFLPQNKLESMW